MSEMHQFSIKPKICAGKGALGYLGTNLRGRVGIVTDAFMVSSGTLERITEQLQACTIELFSEITPDPSVQLVYRGSALFAAFKPDWIIALGGGSPIDAAKAMVASLKQLMPGSAPGFIVIPTTSGTGSEVTNYAVISDPENNSKFPLVSDDLLPDVALLDPELTRTVPPAITADTGMDVLTHCLEAYVGKGATDFSDAMAEKAFSIAFKWLPIAWADGNNLIAREKMHIASCMAGIAFNAAGLGVNHGISHALGALLHKPHGRLNALLLPHVMEFNAGLGQSIGSNNFTATSRYAALARLCGWEGGTDKQGARWLIRNIIKMSLVMKVPSSLLDMGVSREKLEESRDAIIKAALADPTTAGNPRQVSAQDVSEILKSISGLPSKKW